MTRLRELAQVAVPFVWFGMVVGISIIETPLKFRAPGVTQALGLGIGRLVFRALNLTEFVLLLALTAAVAGATVGATHWALTAGLWVILPVQALVLRPLLDQRVQLIIDGTPPPPSSLHLYYIALETGKLIMLVALGVMSVNQLLRTGP